MIKILIVCSGNYKPVSPFIAEQVLSLRKLGVTIDFFLIKGKGILGYLNNYPSMMRKIKHFNPSIIHAHYGLSGMLAILQRKVPVIVTFHGSDINDRGYERIFSLIAIKFSAYNIFVSTKLAKNARVKNKYSVVSCGVDMNSIFPLDKKESRKKLGLNEDTKYILFSSSFSRKEKNYKLALKVINKLKDAQLIELTGFTRTEVNMLMNACDLLLVTSHNESGPLVVKEAIACGCPVVSVDVGDVREIIGKVDGCYLTSYSITEIASKIELVFKSCNRLDSRNKIYELKLDSDTVAKKIRSIYYQIMKPL